MKSKSSLSVVVFYFFFACYLTFIYYPKWSGPDIEATISWDVSGYYFYLPATFIYKDLKQLDFKDKVLAKYQPTPNLQQAFLHESGNYVMKYSCGMAIQYLPFFTVAHVYASLSPSYPADGFSRPYQFMISLASLIVALIGLWFLRKTLLQYFEDIPVTLALISICLGSNYLEYSSITGTMSHNYLFTIYSLLIYNTIRFYETPKKRTAIAIGLLVGLAALTRPTEIICLLIPVLWGLRFKGNFTENVRDHFVFLKQHASKILLAVSCCLLLGSIQLIYWKYASGEWIVYSYEDQGFDWWSPHIEEGIFGFKTGWLVYTPIMILGVLGFLPLWQKKFPGFGAMFFFFGLSFYLVFTWSVFDYGGGVGIRAMIQSYAILAFPLAAFYRFTLNKKSKIFRFSIIAFFALCLYYNIWLTINAHKGGLLHAGHMTKAYWLQVVGTWKQDSNDLKLLDNDEAFYGKRNDIQLIYQNDFEVPDSNFATCDMVAIQGSQSFCLHAKREYSPIYFAEIPDKASWVRVNADFSCCLREKEVWRMPQLIVRAYNKKDIIKTKSIRILRHLTEDDSKSLFMDFKLPPGEKVDSLGTFIWNAKSQKPLLMDNLKIEAFN